MRIERIRLAGGFINDVCLVSEVDRRVVEKIYAGDEKIGKERGERMRREALALRCFYPRGIAPQLFFKDNNFLWQEFVEGNNLEEVLCNLNDDKQKTKLFLKLGEVLRNIHTPVRRSPLYLQEDLEKKWQTALEEVKEGKHFDISRVTLREIDWDEVFRRGTTRVHRDFWPGNVIITVGGKIKVIDWELAGIGSPYEDFAILELWTFPGHSDEVISAFWTGYREWPNKEVTLAFLQRRLIQFLATYRGEDPIGFYEDKWRLLLELSQ